MLSLEEKYRADQMASHATARLDGIEEGLEIGREEGLEKGLKRGLKRGRKEGREEGLEKGLTRGRKEGREEGREEGASAREMEIARNMKAEGSETSFIMKVTGLSEKEIDEL